jgi:putative alpha-1,2-mannosidase
MEITSPMFSRITFQLNGNYATGESFTIVAHDNSEQNLYIQRAELNGEPYEKCYINFSDIASGGELQLWMGAEPSEWGK